MFQLMVSLFAENPVCKRGPLNRGESKPIERMLKIKSLVDQQMLVKPYVEVTETGDKSFISQVQSLISQAQSQPSRAEWLTK